MMKALLGLQLFEVSAVTGAGTVPLLGIVGGVFLLFLLLIFVTGYVKAPPDTAMIISGLRKNPKVLIGKAGVKIPFFERKDELNLDRKSVV